MPHMTDTTTEHYQRRQKTQRLISAYKKAAARIFRCSENFVSNVSVAMDRSGADVTLSVWVNASEARED